MSENQLRDLKWDRWAWGGLCFTLGALAFLAPFWPGNVIEHYLGEWLIAATSLNIGLYFADLNSIKVTGLWISRCSGRALGCYPSPGAHGNNCSRDFQPQR